MIHVPGHAHLPAIKIVYQDKSCYQDKVNRAAGQRTGVMVFAKQLINYTLT